MSDDLVIPVDIYTRHDLNSGAKILFAALCAWPDATIDSIAVTIGMSERSAWRLLNELESAGLVKRSVRTMTVTRSVNRHCRVVEAPR